MEQNNNTIEDLQDTNQIPETWDNWEEITKRTFGRDYKIY